MIVSEQTGLSLWQNLSHQLSIFREAGQATSQASLKININRLCFATVIAIPMHTGFMLYFALSGDHHRDGLVSVWQTGLVAAHSVMLIVMLITGILARHFRKSHTSRYSFLLPYAFAIIVFAAGLSITAVDQLVNAGIAPFMTAAIIIGTVLLIRPYHATVLFVLFYLIFFFMIGLSNHESSIIISYRINGLTITLVGYLLSVLMWRNQTQVVIQQEKIKQQKDELARLAFYDPLTGLANRRLFDELVNREIDKMKQDGTTSSLVIFDIDHFKSINDQHGHIAGDVILKQLTAHVKENIRSTDSIARFGGEEFIILMPHTSTLEARNVAEKLREALSQHDFLTGNKKVRLTASFGVSELSAVNNAQAGHFYAEADQALYFAKNSGRNRVEVHDGNPSPFISQHSAVHQYHQLRSE